MARTNLDGWMHAHTHTYTLADMSRFTARGLNKNESR